MIKIQRKADTNFGCLILLFNQVYTGNNIYVNRAARKMARKYGFTMKYERIISKTNKVIRIYLLYF
jgi:hypothetical protein